MSALKLTDEAVLEYLAANPDFLERNPAALESIRLPSDAKAESLIDYQVSVLRDRNRELKRKLERYHEIAATNEALLARIHSFHLALLEAAGPVALLDAVERRLRDEFDCDEVALALAAGHALPEHRLIVSLDGPRGEFRRQREPLCGRLRRARLEALFGDRADALRSAAIVPLRRDGALGILALGSADEHKFHPGMGTLFLSLLGQMLGQCLARWAAAAQPPAQAVE